MKEGDSKLHAGLACIMLTASSSLFPTWLLDSGSLAFTTNQKVGRLFSGDLSKPQRKKERCWHLVFFCMQGKTNHLCARHDSILLHSQQEFKVILRYTASSGPALATISPCLKQRNNQKKNATDV